MDERNVVSCSLNQPHLTRAPFFAVLGTIDKSLIRSGKETAIPTHPHITPSSTRTIDNPPFLPHTMAFPAPSNSTASYCSPISLPESQMVPPPLPRRRCEQLPRLSNVEMEINPLLVNGIVYNIRAPTFSANCPSMHHSPQGVNAWRYEPAVHPNVPSLTIYLDIDPHQPIVVFPTDSYGAVITIAHVLAAVNQRLTAMGDALLGNVYWAGLVPSFTERDVWVLRTT